MFRGTGSSIHEFNERWNPLIMDTLYGAEDSTSDSGLTYLLHRYKPVFYLPTDFLSKGQGALEFPIDFDNRDNLSRKTSYRHRYREQSRLDEMPFNQVTYIGF